MRQYGELLFQVTRLGLVNVQLLREDDGLSLIDTGLPGMAPIILRAAGRIGLPIRRILLTHAHMDHLGSLDALHAALPDAEVLISARDARFVRGDMSLDPEEPQRPLKGAYVQPKTVPTRLLQDGDRIGSLRAVATPGHTPGHLAFQDTRDGAVLAGDALQSRAGGLRVCFDSAPLFPLVAQGSWAPDLALQSARRLLDLNPSRLALGHGPVLEAPRALLERATAHAEARLRHRA